MPRLIDKLDAASGLVPESLSDEVDYLVQRPAPEALIQPDGTYAAGWFADFPGALNLADSSAMRMSLQRWFHLTVDAPEFFVVANLANLTRASNNALLVVNKESGRFHQASLTRMFPNAAVEVDERAARFRDRETGSFVSVGPDGSVEIALNSGGLHLVARLRPALGPPLVQVTRFQRGRGALQWFGALEIEHGSVALHDRVIALPPGTLATYDRTVGHMRGLQNWNWLAAAGQAVDRATGARVPVAVQIAQDRAEARPRVHARKYAVWVDGRLIRLHAARFDYDLLDPEHRKTSPWRIQAEGPDDAALDVILDPRHHRREARARVLVRADFNQYYGPLSGELRVGGRRFALDGLTAVAEDSLLEL